MKKLQISTATVCFSLESFFIRLQMIKIDSLLCLNNDLKRKFHQHFNWPTYIPGQKAAKGVGIGGRGGEKKCTYWQLALYFSVQIRDSFTASGLCLYWWGFFKRQEIRDVFNCSSEHLTTSWEKGIVWIAWSWYAAVLWRAVVHHHTNLCILAADCKLF